MKQLICANEATYEVCNETVCFPSGSANVRNVLELWMPESAMAFDEFEALCKDGQAMQRIVLKEPSQKRDCLPAWNSLLSSNANLWNWG